jgi:hypothetical protein
MWAECSEKNVQDRLYFVATGDDYPSRCALLTLVFALLAQVVNSPMDIERLLGREWTKRVGVIRSTSDSALVASLFADGALTPAHRVLTLLNACVGGASDVRHLMHTLPPAISVCLHAAMVEAGEAGAFTKLVNDNRWVLNHFFNLHITMQSSNAVIIKRRR